MTHSVTRRRADPKRPLLGLRRKPGRLALTAFRMPLNAYRHDAGWIFGRTFLQLTHTGRKSGKRYDAVAMVLRYDEATREAIICAAWGPETDWYRNLKAGPAVIVRLGKRVIHPEASVSHRRRGVRCGQALPPPSSTPASADQHHPRVG